MDYKILDSVELPIIVISSILNKAGKIGDFRIEFANHSICKISSGRIQGNQKLSRCSPTIFQKLDEISEELCLISVSSTYTFNLDKTFINKKISIIANKIKCNMFVLTILSFDIIFKKNFFIQTNSKHERIRKKLYLASVGKDFYLHFQPQICIQNDCIRGFEALLRWNDKELGSVAPSCFIPIAEETSLIVRIGWWVLETAIKTLKSWQNEYNFNGIVCVNVSPIQMQEVDFLKNFCTLVQNYNILPNTLEIEITESVLIDNLHNTIQILNCIKKYHVLISLDDFGTGYSTFRYLQQLPADTLKLDKSLIDDITSQNSVSAHIAKNLIYLSKELGIKTIAEGVECSEQLEVLKTMKCDIVQGFLKGIPMERGDCEKSLLVNNK